MNAVADPPGIDQRWYCQRCGIVPASIVEIVEDGFDGIPRHIVLSDAGNPTGRRHLIGIYDPWAPI